MSIERTLGRNSLYDVLDRILDKGIVIDAWARVSLLGIDMVTVETRVVVATLPTATARIDTSAETSPKLDTFGNAASSHSALLKDEC